MAAVMDVHLADPELFINETILDEFARLRREDPVHLCEESPYGPYWSLTRYADIKAVDQDHQRFSSDAHRGGIVIDDGIFKDEQAEFFLQNFISMDPPQHGPQRKAVTPIVAPASLMNFKQLITSRTRTLLDNLPVGETFDWVPTVSIELTTQMLATLFDFPFEERHRLTRWSDVAAAEGDSPLVGSQEQRIKELTECLETFTALKQQRKEGPASFDLLTMLARDSATADQPAHEFLGNLLLLIVGGNDTTRNSMSGSVNAFHQFPQQLDRIKSNPGLLPNAVAEIIRWQTPLSHMRRTAVEDVQIGGKTIRSGDKVVMWYYSGNRDEDVFSRADLLDVERANARHHLSFGFGIHRCLGMRLAELQLRILWEEILERWQRIEIVGPVERVPSNFINGYTTMPVRIVA